MTYGIPHTVRGWDPTDIVTTVSLGSFDATLPAGYVAVVRAAEATGPNITGPVILVPTVALTPVDTTPAEPEPGVYFIGKDGEAWQHFEDRADDQRWCVVGYQPILTWRQVWEQVGGPGITPRRLVPAQEPVPLPWDPNPHDPSNLDQTRTSVKVVGRWVHDENVVGRTGNVVRLTADDAEIKGRALVSAARAAREVKP